MINRRILPTLALTGVLALGTAGAAQAKHGTDDGPAHHAKKHHKHHHGQGQHRHGGNDDGPNHT